MLWDIQSGLFDFFLTPDTAIVWPTKWASRRQGDRWRSEREMSSPTEQQAGEHRLHNNEFVSTVQPARLLICGRGWLRDNANAPRAARQLLHKRILLPWQKRDGEAWVVMEGQFVQHEETGFIRLQGQNKEAIIDESAQHQRRSEITLYKQSQWRQAKRETEALLHACAPTLSVHLVCFIFPHSSGTIVQGRSWRAPTTFPTNSRRGGKRGHPHQGCLAALLSLSGSQRRRRRHFEITPEFAWSGSASAVAHVHVGYYTGR